MEFHDPPALPAGFSCASRHVGLKESEPDLALFASEVDAAAAAVFTRNRFPGAPITLGRETIRSGVLRGIVVNSRFSNVATGSRGIEHARSMAAAAAMELGCDPARILVSSTGVIGVPLPIDRILAGIRGLAQELQGDPLVGVAGMMTTDSYPKALSASVGGATITWVAKGSGMIEPNMATMLAYIFTDASIGAGALDSMLRDAVADSFNMLSVDGDTSTSDTCAMLANGVSGEVDREAFASTLRAGCVRIAEMLARDGEGATRLLRVQVRNAASMDDARRIAKSLVNSPLVKTMVHGADPNVGRILMAIGKQVDCVVEPSRVGAWVNGHEVIRGGERTGFDEPAVRAALQVDTVELLVELGVGSASTTAFGCDLGAGYIEENGAYYSS
jgi:glutamate N-acetyltransferase / amino-acid N-acetyltransferase